MTERNGNVTRLGVYQRAVAQRLHEVIPMGVEAAMDAMYPRGPGVDQGYALATLQRLVDRGIAKHYGMTMSFVRGEHWEAAAKYYGWTP